MSENENLSLEVFDSPEFGQMRILREGDKYLFCANDAAVALGYSNPRAALQRHCKGVAKRDTLTPGGVQSLSYIAEGDLYRLIIHSKIVTGLKDESGSIKVTCRHCQLVMVRKLKSRRRDILELFPPKGAVPVRCAYGR